VRNKFAGGDSEDSGLSWTPHESSAHSACEAGCGGGIFLIRCAPDLPNAGARGLRLGLAAYLLCPIGVALQVYLKSLPKAFILE
jgi:hypothetical protein